MTRGERRNCTSTHHQQRLHKFLSLRADRLRKSDQAAGLDRPPRLTPPPLRALSNSSRYRVIISRLRTVTTGCCCSIVRPRRAARLHRRNILLVYFCLAAAAAETGVSLARTGGLPHASRPALPTDLNPSRRADLCPCCNGQRGRKRSRYQR